MSNLQEYTNKIINWAEERGLTTADPVGQMYKLIEEFGETAEGIAKDRPADVKDGIGDMFVVKTIMEQQVDNNPKFYQNLTEEERSFLELLRLIGDMANRMIEGNIVGDCFIDYLQWFAKSKNLNLTDCVEQAYNEIKDRKGKMVNGVFVKESDLNGETNNVITPYDVKLKRIRNIVELHGEDGNWNNNIGNMGMYNGMELILAVLEDREPKYRTLKDEQADLEVQERY